jgi:hypothetical protein
MKHIFSIELSGTATVEIDDQAIQVVDDDWRESLYNLRTPEEIARHIAYNLIVNNARLSQLDGWADQPDDNAKITESPEWEVKAELVKR